MEWCTDWSCNFNTPAPAPLPILQLNISENWNLTATTPFQSTNVVPLKPFQVEYFHSNYLPSNTVSFCWTLIKNTVRIEEIINKMSKWLFILWKNFLKCYARDVTSCLWNRCLQYRFHKRFISDSLLLIIHESFMK